MADDLKPAIAPRRGLPVDVAKYQGMIDDPDLTEDQKRQFVEALWTILVAFVDLGFELHESDLACGNLAKDYDQVFGAEPHVVELESFLASKFETASVAADDGSQKESDDEI